MAFFGDGATNIGAFHEAANMACALNLPVIFICENNEYAEFTPRVKTMAIADIADRAAAYGMPGVIVDGMDVLAVYEAARAKARARRGEGPSLIEAKTYRYYDHHGIKRIGRKYRTATRSTLGSPATPSHSKTAGRGRAMRQVGIRGHMGRDRVTRSTTPSNSPSTALPRPRRTPGRRLHGTQRHRRKQPVTRNITYVKAFNEAMHQVMAEDRPSSSPVRTLAAYGGVFHSFDGLNAEFGDKRVIDTPIAEQAIIGLGIGAAAVGLRPVST